MYISISLKVDASYNRCIKP